MIYLLITLHLLDAGLTWRYGRNTEYGILFKHLTGSAWKFWPARLGFIAVIVLGCELYPTAHLYWAAVGAQGMALYTIYAAWRYKR